MCGGQCDEGWGECRFCNPGTTTEIFIRELSSILLSVFNRGIIYTNNIVIDKKAHYLPDLRRCAYFVYEDSYCIRSTICEVEGLPNDCGT